jgi:F-type H+-transporting ATPase subunit b
MQIDLFTFVAQIVNFLILMALLRIFLYKPILNAMNQREEKIASRLEEAREKEKQAQQRAEDYRQKQQEIERRREEILNEAREEVRQRRQEWLSEAQEEVEHAKSDWHTDLQQEKERFWQQFQQRAGQQFLAIARQALRDLADANLERQVVITFTGRLESLDEQDEFRDILRQSDEAPVVRSAFELSDDMKQQLSVALNQHISNKKDIQFRQDSELISGLAIQLDGHELSWSIRHYLTSLEERLTGMIEEEIGRPAPAADEQAEDESQKVAS